GTYATAADQNPGEQDLDDPFADFDGCIGVVQHVELGSVSGQGHGRSEVEEPADGAEFRREDEALAHHEDHQEQGEGERKFAFAGAEEQEKEEKRRKYHLNDFPDLVIVAVLFVGLIAEQEVGLVAAQGLDAYAGS